MVVADALAGIGDEEHFADAGHDDADVFNRPIDLLVDVARRHRHPRRQLVLDPADQFLLLERLQIGIDRAALGARRIVRRNTEVDDFEEPSPA